MTPPPSQSQREVFAFLQNPTTYGRTEPVIRIDTHGAVVFLAGPDVYKVKRAVHFPFMDFSTLEKRHAVCKAELAVNRGNAPDLYLGIVPLTRDGDVLRLGGSGEVIEWAVHLRRFDENATLDRLATRGPFSVELIDKLSRTVIAAHRRAAPRDGCTATRNLQRLLQETLDELGAAAAASAFAPDRVVTFGAALVAEFAKVEPILLSRGERGQVRRCHGDLHLGNLVLIEDEPVMFDALEFDEAIATCDVLYDLAFLLMDLCKRALRGNANRLFNCYLSMSDEPLQIVGLATLPLFLSLRAAIRAKVNAELFRLDPERNMLRLEALGYFEAAIGFLAPVPPQLIAIGGLSGTGKTTVAAAIAPSLGRAPGALHLRSDVERKHRFAVAETARLPAGAYKPDISVMVYSTLHDFAETALRAGQAVIVDATYLGLEERDSIAAVAARAGVPFMGLWLEAPTEILVRRIEERSRDASDATAAVVKSQAKQVLGTLNWRHVDSSQAPDALRSTILDLVRHPELQTSSARPT